MPDNLNHDNAPSRSYSFAFSVLVSLFFFWGFITCLNDILIPHLKAEFDLSYFEATLIQFCFFTAYLLVSIPAGNMVSRIGYKNGIVTGLFVTSVGCLLFIPAASWEIYSLFLGALFVLASGITILQVSANPYVNALGSEETASSRLNLSQGFNALGTTLAPVLGGGLILAGASSLDSNIGTVKLPYLILAILLSLVALTFINLNLPSISHERGEKISTLALLKRFPTLTFGCVSLFAYVGAEVAIGSLLINYLGLDNIKGLAENQAAHFVAFYWGGAMIGRFIGSVIMRFIKPALLLSFNAILALTLLVMVVHADGDIAFGAVLLIGLFNSIMFPTIFSLSLRGTGVYSAQASGVLCLTIFGGAVVPLIQGAVADTAGLQESFYVPMVSYLAILLFALHVLKNKSQN